MRFRLIIALLLGSLSSINAISEEAAEETDDTRYVDLTPAFVTNYGGPGRMRYIKAEVSLRVESQEAFRAVMHHNPSLRHALVMLLSRQTDQTIEGSAAKDQLRIAALEELRGVMDHEEGDPMIEDILFSSFFVQK